MKFPRNIKEAKKIQLELRQGAIDIVLACTSRYRLPEPIRRADSLSKALKKDLIS